jgi:Bacterial dnaA protein helix-turn-helix
MNDMERMVFNKAILMARSAPKIPPPNPTAAALIEIASLPSPAPLPRDMLPGVAPWRGLATLPPAPRRVTPREIIFAIAIEFGLTPEQIKGNFRTKECVFARHIAQYLAMRICGLSSPVVGRIFYRDHTSVLHGWRKVKLRMAEDPALCERIERLERELRANI